MYQHLSAKSGRQISARAGNFLDLPARRAGNVFHFVSIAVNEEYMLTALHSMRPMIEARCHQVNNEKKTDKRIKKNNKYRKKVFSAAYEY